MKYIAKFEKVSLKEFMNSVKAYNDIYTEEEIANIYKSIEMPKRATEGSAGYDFVTPLDIDVPSLKCNNSNKTKLVPTGIRCKIERGFVLKLYPRSSVGIKKNLELANTVGIIDSDYYLADNEGHIKFSLRNNNDEPVKIKANERVVQGLFIEHFFAEEEDVVSKRSGGFGSTNK